MSPQRLLMLGLLGLAALYAAWFARGEHALAALLVFVLPPLLLCVAVWRGWRRAGFTAGVLALLWFSHGVMHAWAETEGRGYAIAAVLLALFIVYAACLPGMRLRAAARGNRNA